MPQTYTFQPSSAGQPTITIQVGLTETNQVMPGGTAGVAYSHQFVPGGNFVAPVSYSLASGAWPPGLSMSASGLVSGTPTSSGTFALPVVRLTDAS